MTIIVTRMIVHLPTDCLSKQDYMKYINMNNSHAIDYLEEVLNKINHLTELLNERNIPCPVELTNFTNKISNTTNVTSTETSSTNDDAKADIRN